MSSALIVTDMLNDYSHDDAEPLRASVREVVPVLAVAYTFGPWWRSNVRRQ